MYAHAIVCLIYTPVVKHLNVDITNLLLMCMEETMVKMP